LVNCCEEIIMLRSIGSVTFLALFMVACGGGGSGGGVSLATHSIGGTVATYTVGGTVSGLLGSGLTLVICNHAAGPGGGLTFCHNQKQIGADGAFTLDSSYSAGGSNFAYISITQQPSSPPQDCAIGNAVVSASSDTSVTVSCADYLAHFYVTNATDNTLLAYSIDATTGVAALIGGPTLTGASPYAIFGFKFADKKYVYVGDEGSHDVSAFAVDPTTGALTAVRGSPFAAGTDPQAMVFDGIESLYVANAGSDNVSVYAIDGNTGALTPRPGSPVAVGTSPTSIISDPDGSQIYVANHGGSNDISEFGLGSPLTLISSVSAGGNPLSLALGAGGKFVYSANPDTTHPSISGFSVDPGTGALSPLTGSPFPLPVSHYIATDQTGTYLYVTSGSGIVGYAIDATTGALTPLLGFPLATDANAYSITIDPTNRILYVTNDGAANVSGFTLDASSGALTPMAGSPFPAGNHPEFIATF
jgi:6-phosphogluconolactonase